MLTNLSSSVESQSNDNSSLALRDIRLSIQSGEKIAICGRTGSGKSSLVSLLLKLLDPLPGTAEKAVVVSDLPLQRINRSALRQHIIAVPQEAVFLPDGTSFQTNLDPSEVCTPEECQAVISAVGLWEFVQERGGLNVAMMAGTLSAGQRQLMSLGRAVLRRRIRAKKNPSSEGGILLLDEVNSSVDHDMERIMNELIRTEFKAYTVIAVSHRLDMIMDFDRVIVMDTGEIVEVGNPLELADTAGTRFGSLVKAGAK
jgi:ABC-type multidrug transport system fused ATPase/permease subunit